MVGGQRNLDQIKSLLFIPFVFIILISTINIKGEEWNGISPLKSTRSDVEKFFGKCKDGYSQSNCLYKMEEKNVYIEYSEDSACEKGGIWNVPNGTVLTISVYLKNGGVMLRNLQLDLKDFVKEEDPELVPITHFRNENKGISFEVNGGFARTFRYGPSAEERKKYICVKS